jgi:hypothetical protein
LGSVTEDSLASNQFLSRSLASVMVLSAAYINASNSDTILSS